MATLPEFKGRGLAQYAMASLANHIKGDLDLVPFCNIMTDNSASLRVAQKVGLKRVGEVYWMMWTPQRFRNKPTDFDHRCMSFDDISVDLRRMTGTQILWNVVCDFELHYIRRSALL